MPKKMTNETFIEKAHKIHNNKYDYSKVNYVNNHTKVCIICPIHGEFWQTPSSHINQKCGCPYCDKSLKMTNETFIEKAKKIHNDKYDYSKVEYVNSQTKVCIICPIHGEFWQMPQNHLKGQNCPKCSHRSYKKTKKEFIEESIKIHNNKYDYSKVEYTNIHTKVCIICPIHGEFWQTPEKHLKGQNCPKCAKNYKLNLKTFIEKAHKIHNNKYDYSKVEYINHSTKIKIICPIHGEFWQTPHSHLNGCGCQQCANETNISETKIFSYLKENTNYNIIRQKKFDWLNGKSIDIFIENLNIAIEYQGIQHFKPNDFFGGIKSFIETVKRDKKKYEECKKNNIKLLYFTYLKDDKIPNKYYDIIYNKEEDLLNIINNYGINRRN